MKLTMNLTEVAQLFRQHGVPADPNKIADGIATGRYPFGKLIAVSPNGRRTFEIWRVDVLRFLEDKTPQSIKEELIWKKD